MTRHSILCVDDEENILSSLERVFLEEEDYEIITANSGEKGLAILNERKIDLIISDQRMPGMSGTEFLKQARSLHPDTIRIVLSGYADFDTVTAAINEGEIYRLIQKPWQEYELLSVVKDSLEKYDLMRENKKLQKEISKQNEELKTLNHQLEERVKDRTRKLEMSNQVLLLSQEILHHLSNPIVGISSNGMIVLINKEAQNVYEDNGMSLMGKNIKDVFSEDVVNIIQKTFQTKQMQTADDIICNHNQLGLKCLPLSGQFSERGVILETEVRNEGADANNG
ncbi:MAG: response regulator [Syntrophaceae bacterium]|nr:response regulator [Syntrophaceae bacterium]